MRPRSQPLGGQRPAAGASVVAAAVAFLRGARAAGVASVAVAAAPLPASLQWSRDFDLYNQGQAVQYFEQRFYEGGVSVLSDGDLEQVEGLRQQALQEPVLALAAAQVLYMFGWFRSTGEVIRGNVVASAQLFERSISAGSCRSDVPKEAWHDNACDMRWMHSALLYSWLGDTEGDAEQGRVYREKAQHLSQGMQRAAAHAEAGKLWSSPLHLNFNSMIFPGKPSRPIWDTQKVAMGRFLEENHHIFKAELEAILNDPRDLFGQLVLLDASREHLASPGSWDTVRVVRYHHWFDLFCEMAPLTCDLVKSRPELTSCSFMNVNYVKLNPGAHLKPHFGNGPRLSAHLSVIAPEPMRAAMQVGTERVLWLEGKAIVFDDTYPHSVSHWGVLPRYVLLVWFCHPCDTGHRHEQECPDA